jgi:hypothetical protein
LAFAFGVEGFLIEIRTGIPHHEQPWGRMVWDRHMPEHPQGWKEEAARLSSLTEEQAREIRDELNTKITLQMDRLVDSGLRRNEHVSGAYS